MSDKPRRHHRYRTIQHVLWAAAALAVGGGLSALLVIKAEPPERTQTANAGPLVAVHIAERVDQPVVVSGHGTVEPRVRIDLVPQVSGKVVYTAPSLTDGGEFDANEVLIRIEPVDYELAVEQAEAAVSTAAARVAEVESTLQSARTNLEIEQAEAQVARDSWRKTHPDQEPTALVARQPQLRRAQAAVKSAASQLVSAKAEVASAKARLRDAALQLERTELTVPFRGRVTRESVDVGQYVTAGQPLADVYARDRLQVVVPIEDRHLRWFDLARPGPAASRSQTPGQGSVVHLTSRFAGEPRRWRGHAVRTAGEVDPQSRLIDVIIEVDQTDSPADGVALLPGAFVDVAIQGKALEGVIAVPRHAMRELDGLWVAEDLQPLADDPNRATEPLMRGKLVKRTVEVIRSDRDRAYIGEGLAPGDAVIVSLLDVATDGMTVRVPAAAVSAQASARE